MRLPFEKHYKNQTHSLAHSHSFIRVLEALTLPSFLSFIPKSKPKFPPSTFSPKSTTTTVKPIHIYFIRIYTYREWVREREEWIRIKASFSSVGFHGIRRRTSSRSISVTTTTFWALPSCGRRTLGSQGASVSSFLRILTF